MPVVAISGFRLAAGRVSRWASGGFALPEPYVAALRRAGVQPVILCPPFAPATPTAS